MDGFDTLPDGLRLCREAGSFKLNTDSIILCDFIRFRAARARLCCDLGAGAGVISLMLAHSHPPLRADGVELQAEAVRVFERNIAENGMSGRVRAFHRDLRDCHQLLGTGGYDLVVSNPPYFSTVSPVAASEERALMRSELGCTVSELCEAASKLLKNGGRFAVVFRPERLSELFCAMTRSGIEPKRLCFAARSPQSRPTLALVEGRRQGKPGLVVEPMILSGG